MSSHEIEKLKRRFRKLVETDQAQAIRLLNHEEVKFPTLFTVRDEVEKAGIFTKLNERNQLALTLTSEFMDEQVYYEPIPIKNSISDSLLISKSTLEWMVKTGGFHTIHSSYLKVIDKAVIYTLHVFHDVTMVPVVVDMLFFRCRKALYYEHLCWAILELENPDCLLPFAEYITSDNQKERNLALQLLSCVPGLEHVNDPNEQIQWFCEWFYHNREFLVYNQESLDFSNRPLAFVPSLEAQYFGKAVTPFSPQWKISLHEKEKRFASEFAKLDQEMQKKLAQYSCTLRRRNREGWKEWLTLPFAEQLKQVGEGLL